MYFISKIIFTMLFWVVVARWGYAEIAQVSPVLRASIDRVMEVATIPTHDRWDMDAAKDFASNIVASFKVEQAFAGDNDFSAAYETLSEPLSGR
jgi:hypothetical protein